MSVLWEWRQTPYIHGAALKGIGADCVGFVCKVVDQLYGIDTYSKRPFYSAAHGFRDCNANAELVRFFRTNWPSEVIEPALDGKLEVEPGDIIVTRASLGVGHISMVGPVKNTVWHSTQGSGVEMIGLCSVGEVVKAYKLLRKIEWT